MVDNKIKLVFVRHGESEKNILGIKSSTLDTWPLTAKGKKHAQNLADKLKQMGPFDIILSSPLLRTRQTAEIIGTKLAVPIKFEVLLSERDYGRWNDLTKQDLEENHADYREYKQHRSGTTEHFNFKTGGAESKADVVERVKRFIGQVAKEYPGKNILVVSHGVINGAIAMALGATSLESFYNKELIGYEDIETYSV